MDGNRSTGDCSYITWFFLGNGCIQTSNHLGCNGNVKTWNLFQIERDLILPSQKYFERFYMISCN